MAGVRWLWLSGRRQDHTLDDANGSIAGRIDSFTKDNAEAKDGGLQPLSCKSLKDDKITEHTSYYNWFYSVDDSLNFIL